MARATAEEDGSGAPGSAATLVAAVEGLTETLVLARLLIQAGVRIDLGGLDREVSDLCADAVALPRAEGREMSTPLADLLVEIEQLERAMERRPPPR